MRTRRTILHSVAAAGLLLLPATVTVQAQQPTSAQTSAIRASCRSDFMSHCSGVTPGGADALNCLKRNVEALSGACKTAVSAVMPAPAAAPAAPAAPSPTPAAETTPASAPPAGAKPAKPVKPLRAQLTPPPAASLSPPPPPAVATPAVAPLHPRPFILPQRRLVIEGICHADARELCSGTLPIGRQLIDYLADHAADLSRQCYDAIARISTR